MTLSTKSLDGDRTGSSHRYGETQVRSDHSLPAWKGLLRVEEAAEWLGLGRTKAWELVYSGTLPSVTIGRSRRVPVQALQTFVERLVEEGGV
jgi:excisionase family DNA binding protein